MNYPGIFFERCGMVTMQTTGGSGGFGHNGNFYPADDGGFIDVPEDAVKDAEVHGFVVAQRPDPVKTKK